MLLLRTFGYKYKDKQNIHLGTKAVFFKNERRINLHALHSVNYDEDAKDVIPRQQYPVNTRDRRLRSSTTLIAECTTSKPTTQESETFVKTITLTLKLSIVLTDIWSMWLCMKTK